MKSTSRRRVKRARFVSLRRHLKCDDEATWREQEGNVAERFFAGAEEENSLRGLLDEEATDQAVKESAVSPVSAAYDEAGSLERAAMRSTRREEEVVRWVKMSEVQVSDEATSSSSCARARPSETNGVLALKLDYKEVEDAWDKGRPFFHSQPSSNSQIVPDLTTDNHFFYHHNLNDANGEQWGVPDQNSCNHNHGMERKGEQSIEGWRLGQREASVLRYKEKRMNRLFSKRIRYQVRKLNAEKRPRIKGRFVKRS